MLGTLESFALTTIKPSPKKKRDGPWTQLLIGCMEIGCHYFWPGLIALPKNTLPIEEAMVHSH